MTTTTLYTTCVLYTGRSTRSESPRAKHSDITESYLYAQSLARTEHIVAVFEGEDRGRALVSWVYGQEMLPK